MKHTNHLETPSQDTTANLQQVSEGAGIDGLANLVYTHNYITFVSFSFKIVRLASCVHFFHSLKAFCFCREFHCNVLEMLSIQSSLCLFIGITLGKG
jgi:hypothetical protein